MRHIGRWVVPVDVPVARCPPAPVDSGAHLQQTYVICCHVCQSHAVQHPIAPSANSVDKMEVDGTTPVALTCRPDGADTVWLRELCCQTGSTVK
jgi:hypothetical protein